VTIALRTQQIVAHETGVANTIDPLGGSYFVEWMTDKIEAEALDYIRRIDDMGGMLSAVEKGYPQREIAGAAYRFQRQVERREKVMVGVNDFAMKGESARIPTLKVDEETQRLQCERLAGVKAARDPARVAAALDAVRAAARGSVNLCPPIIEAAKAYCSEQEVCDVLREVFGTHTDPAEF
jgi:methylmalonyl-CoA mutase N-terminal domain/subunit